jgi:hypothetical protein
MSTLTQLAVRIDREAAEFDTLQLRPFAEAFRESKKPGIYALFENGNPVYVGRTRNLAQRFRAHVAASHNSASFALKRTRSIHGLQATYQKIGSRAEIVSSPVTRATFLSEIEKIRAMNFRFKEVPDPIDQYLLELAITLRYELPIDGFDSH